MGRYDALLGYRDASERDSETMRLDEIGALLESPLPASARKYPAFWSSANHIGRLLRSRGWDAKPRLSARAVVFVREQRGSSALSTGSDPDESSDLVLVGCVKGKHSGRHAAKDRYSSALFGGRRAEAEALGAPWFILSAEHGLLSPEMKIDAYERSLADASAQERREWSASVLDALDRVAGPLAGRNVQIMAGAEYRDDGLVEGLRARGAKVSELLKGVPLGEQLRWFKSRHGGRTDTSAEPVSTPGTPPGDVTTIVEQLTREFANEAWERVERRKAPRPGWAGMPEFHAAESLRARGCDAVTFRYLLTLVAAMDRARNADALWRNAVRLFDVAPWTSDPAQVVQRSFGELRDALAGSGVSQRHLVDSAAWLAICEALQHPRSPRAVRDAITQGEGSVEELTAALNETSPGGQPWFPLLQGPKGSVLWIRMLAEPGGASISGLRQLPVAVDVQVRKVTEYLGVTDTRGLKLEAARPEIQRAWMKGADAAIGPPALTGSGAALDPALWFFGTWGCTFCERDGARTPISPLCERCQFQPA